MSSSLESFSCFASLKFPDSHSFRSMIALRLFKLLALLTNRLYKILISHNVNTSVNRQRINS